MHPAAAVIFKALERLAIGRLTMRLPDGSSRDFGTPDTTLRAEINIHDWRFFRRVLLDGDIGFAEAYVDGLCDSPDLPRLIALLAENERLLAVDRKNPCAICC